MSNANEVVVRYLAAWNEPEPKRRRELVAKAWIDDGTYVDAARVGKGHHDYLRFSWVAGGTADAPLYIKGTDFVVVAGDGQIKSVVGFVDAAPARG